MSVQQIQEAVRGLNAEQLVEFRRWFAEYDAATWDQEFAEDVQTGKLHTLAVEALADLKAGRCTKR
jgi:hypothetical protein